MKLADSTIYNDGDLTLPTTENSIICSTFDGEARFMVLGGGKSPIPKDFWAVTQYVALPARALKNIVIIYRAPADGSKGPELIEDLYDIKEDEYDDEYLEEKLDSLKRTLNRGVEKIVGIARVILEEN